MLFKRIFKSKKPVNNIGISSSKQSVQIPNIHEIALKRAFFVYYDDKFSHIHRYACGESGNDAVSITLDEYFSALPINEIIDKIKAKLDKQSSEKDA